MPDLRTVLVAGASSVQFPQSAPHTALPNLLKQELESRTPGTEWSAPSALLYPTPSMPERAMALVGQLRPDAIYFVCSAVYAEETVLFSIQRRWRRLYKPAASLSKLFDGPQGEPAQGAPSARGLAFGAARAVARRLAGVAPLVDIRDAIDATVRTLRVLAMLPDLPVACRLTAGGVRDLAQAAEIRRRVDEHNRTISAECLALGFTPLDIVAEMKQAGLSYAYEPDRIHGNLEARRFSARLAAEAILAH